MAVRLSKEIEKRIKEEIRIIDRWIEEARKQIKNKEYKKARESVEEAIKHKRIILALIPSIWVMWTNGEEELAFEPVYDMLAEMDNHAELLEALVIDETTDGIVKFHCPEPDLDDLIARLKVLLQELEVNVTSKPWEDSDDGKELFDNVKKALEELIKGAEKYANDVTEPPGQLYKALVDAKKALFEELSIDVDLWHAYNQLNFIDVMLEISKFNLKDRQDGIEDKDIIEWLENAEKTKHKFQTLITESLIKKNQEELPPSPPQRPEPPKPEYLPGQEDLPPFPPDDHAMRTLEHPLFLGLINVNVTIVKQYGICTHINTSLKLPLLPALTLKQSKHTVISGKNLRWISAEIDC